MLADRPASRPARGALDLRHRHALFLDERTRTGAAGGRLDRHDRRPLSLEGAPRRAHRGFLNLLGIPLAVAGRLGGAAGGAERGRLDLDDRDHLLLRERAVTPAPCGLLNLRDVGPLGSDGAVNRAGRRRHGGVSEPSDGDVPVSGGRPVGGAVGRALQLRRGRVPL